MAEYTDTIDAIGDLAAFNGLVSDTLEEFTDCALFNNDMKQFTFAEANSLKHLNLPGMTGQPPDYICSGCQRLESVSFGAISTISGAQKFEYTVSMDEINHSPTRSVTYSVLVAPYIGILKPQQKDKVNGQVSYGYGATGIYYPPDSTNTSINNIGYGSYTLSCLILPDHKMACSSSPTNVFGSYSPLSHGYGYIYVPSDLINDYISDTNWSAFASQIVSRDEYPKEYVGGTITDSWDEIFAAEDNGTYKTKYSLGDTKIVEINGGAVLMEIIAFDTDILADGSGTAKITWLQTGTIAICSYNTDYLKRKAPAWHGSFIENWLENKIYPKIYPKVRARIQKVKKIYHEYNNQEALVAENNVWIPSTYELNIYKANSDTTDGIHYEYFDTDDRRKRGLGYTTPSTTSSPATSVWLRSVALTTITKHCVLSTTGNFASASDGKLAVTIGFCT